MDPAVGLVRAYLEFSGYFVLTEVPVRTKRGGHYQDLTDIDIVAVRFAHRPVIDSGDEPMSALLGNDRRLETPEAGMGIIIGEVKQGRAELNRGLRRQETVSFALRRTGCCPEEHIAEHARRIVRRGSVRMTLPGGDTCQVRIVAFAGYGAEHDQRILTIPLAHCLHSVCSRLTNRDSGLRDAQFRDPTVGLLALMRKLGAEP
jgi:hypothetical protein